MANHLLDCRVLPAVLHLLVLHLLDLLVLHLPCFIAPSAVRPTAPDSLLRQAERSNCPGQLICPGIYCTYLVLHLLHLLVLHLLGTSLAGTSLAGTAFTGTALVLLHRPVGGPADCTGFSSPPGEAVELSRAAHLPGPSDFVERQRLYTPTSRMSTPTTIGFLHHTASGLGALLTAVIEPATRAAAPCPGSDQSPCE